METPEPLLVRGPYRAPRVRRGASLVDARFGPVEVGGCSTARVPWPYLKRKGQHSLILCGDLLKALKHESIDAIAYYWGVRPYTVIVWRRALGMEDGTPGRWSGSDHEYLRAHAADPLPDVARALGRSIAQVRACQISLGLRSPARSASDARALEARGQEESASSPSRRSGSR